MPVAISLWQPWASLLFVEDAKVHETRHWSAPQRLIGQRIAIHAAKTHEGFRGMEEGDALATLCENRFPKGFSLPRGAFIGSAILTYCAPTERVVPASDWDLIAGNWEPGRFAWRLDDRRPFISPIPAIGRQGFWNFDLIDLIDALPGGAT